MIRIWIETASNSGGAVSGYLLPVGSALSGVSSLLQKQNTSGLNYTENEPITMTISGIATNGVESPVDSEIIDAMAGLTGFLTNNEEIVSVQIVEHDASSMLGGVVTPAPGTPLESYLPAYTSNISNRFEVMSYVVTDPVFPLNFSFQMVLQNLPIADVDRQYAGNLRDADIALSRSLNSGVERNEVMLTLRLQNAGESVEANNLVFKLATGAAVNFANVFTGGLPNASDPAIIDLQHKGLPRGKLANLSTAFNKVTSEFNATIATIRPIQSALRNKGFKNLLEYKVEVVVPTIHGFKFFDIKKKKHPQVVQKTMNDFVQLILKIDAVSYTQVVNINKIINASVAKLLSDKNLIITDDQFAAVSGNVDAGGTEFGRGASVTFNVGVIDPFKFGKGAGSPTVVPGQGADVFDETAEKLSLDFGQKFMATLSGIVEKAFAIATLEAMLGSFTGQPLAIESGDTKLGE